MAHPSVFDTDRIIGDLQRFLGMSGPGDTLHHLVLAEPQTNALGVPDLTLTVCAIDCAYGPNHPNADPPEVFIAKTITASVTHMRSRGARIYLAALLLETHTVIATGEVAENRARRMRADHRLGQHEDAVEMTVLYAADRDGRRYGAANGTPARTPGGPAAPTWPSAAGGWSAFPETCPAIRACSRSWSAVPWTPDEIEELIDSVLRMVGP